MLHNMQKEGELMSLRTSNTTNVEGVKAASEASKKTVNTPEEFQSILWEKIGSIRDTLEEMRAQREAINTVKAEGMVTEVVRRYMPDGSIMITQYVGGKIKDRYRKPPHLELVPDPNSPVPKSEDGRSLTAQQNMVMKPKYSLAEDLFNML